MIVTVDASVLVGELLRERGRALLSHPMLRCMVAEEQSAEALHELDKRIATIIAQGRLNAAQVQVLRHAVVEFLDEGVIEVVPVSAYEHMEAKARRRVPRDPSDWPVVALALVTDAGILTADADFLGCGCPTWTIETLRDELANPDPSPTR